MQNCQKLILDISSIVEYINTHFGSYFQTNQQGIYLIGQSTPAMVPGGYYYKLVKRGNLYEKQIVQNIEGIDDTIYNANGEIIITSFAAKRKYFSDKPAVPIQEKQLVKDIVVNAINRNLAYYTGPIITTDDTIISYFSDDVKVCKTNLRDPNFHEDNLKHRYALEDLVSKIKEPLYDLTANVVTFVKFNEWAEYNLYQLNDMDLVLENVGDYRINHFMRNFKGRNSAR